MTIKKNKSFFDTESAVYYNPATDKKVAVITAGNSGIGWYTVLHLYLHGYSVYLFARSAEKVATAIKEIEAEAKKRAADYTEEQKAERYFGQLHFIPSDLALLKSVDEAVKEFKEKESQVDILINNAGLMASPYELTKDGIEAQYQINLVSHLLLTLELLPLLEASTSARVVQVSSLGHTTARSYHSNTQDLKGFPALYYNGLRYGVAKTALIQVANVFAEKKPSITFVSVHPGIIITDLYSHLYSSIPVLSSISKGLYQALGTFAGVNAENGALASLRAALDSTITSKQYLTTGGIVSSASKIARDQKLSQETWDWNIQELKKRGYDFSDV